MGEVFCNIYLVIYIVDTPSMTEKESIWWGDHPRTLVVLPSRGRGIRRTTPATKMYGRL